MAQDRWSEQHEPMRDRTEAQRRRAEGGYGGFGPHDQPGSGGLSRQRRGLTGRNPAGGEARAAGYTSAGETAGFGGESYGGSVDSGRGGPPDDSGFSRERPGRSGYGVFGGGGDYAATDRDEAGRSGQAQAGHRGRGPRSYVRSDERIREDVCERLTEDPFVDASEVEVAVQSREVTLSGSVDSRQAKRLAEDLAESVSGVAHVQNNLRIRPSGGTGATSTADRIGTEEVTGIAGIRGGPGGLGRAGGRATGSGRRKKAPQEWPQE